MQKGKITIHSKYGIHARPAAKLVEIASQYHSKAVINFDGESIDCQSIIGLLSLMVSEGSEIELQVSGEDEKEAFHKISEFIISMNND